MENVCCSAVEIFRETTMYTGLFKQKHWNLFDYDFKASLTIPKPLYQVKVITVPRSMLPFHNYQQERIRPH